MRLRLLALVGFGWLTACGGPEPGPIPPSGSAALGSAPAEIPGPPPSLGETSAPNASAPPAAATAPPPPAEPPPLPKDVKVLVIGDSFAEALGVGLKSKESETSWKFSLRGEKATFIPEWAGPNRGVALLMAQTKPDLVVIALGGNELAIKTPEIRAPKVKKLVEIIGTTPCVWVTPPLWDLGDNGLIQIIRDNSAPCRLYDSQLHSADLPRGSDKIHPTAAGQKLWAEQFLGWARRERDPAKSPFALKPRPLSE